MELHDVATDDEAWGAKFKVLKENIEHHIKEEETKVFASARLVFSEEEAEKLGTAFEHIKKEMAKDGDSIMASTVDLVANLLPPRLVEGFRKSVKKPRSSDAHAPR